MAFFTRTFIFFPSPGFFFVFFFLPLAFEAQNGERDAVDKNGIRIPRMEGRVLSAVPDLSESTENRPRNFVHSAPRSAVLPRNFVRLEMLQIPGILCTLRLKML